MGSCECLKLPLECILLAKRLQQSCVTLSRFDRTGEHVSRVKMSQDMASAINDGLYFYEDDLWGPSDDDQWVSRGRPVFFFW